MKTINFTDHTIHTTEGNIFPSGLVARVTWNDGLPLVQLHDNYGGACSGIKIRIRWGCMKSILANMAITVPTDSSDDIIDSLASQFGGKSN